MDLQQLFEILILGIVQGITEFLPVSSSGHLVILNELLPGQQSAESDDLAMNIALHLGTLGSILVVYRSDLRNILRDYRMLISIVVATIPIVIIGFTLKDAIESAFETPLVAACGLLATATLLTLSDWLGSHHAPSDTSSSYDDPGTETPSWNQAILIGLFQALAILPGISRAGSTIAGGVMLGVNRDAAARFSFLIAIPAISGATLLQAIDIIRGEAVVSSLGRLGIGAAISFVVGIFALEMLLKIVRKNRLRYFAVYCLAVSLATFAYLLLR